MPAHSVSPRPSPTVADTTVLTPDPILENSTDRHQREVQRVKCLGGMSVCRIGPSRSGMRMVRWLLRSRTMHLVRRFRVGGGREPEPDGEVAMHRQAFESQPEGYAERVTGLCF